MAVSEKCWFCGADVGRFERICPDCQVILAEQDEIERQIKASSDKARSGLRATRWWGYAMIACLCVIGVVSLTQGGWDPIALYASVGIFAALALLNIPMFAYRRRIKDPYTEARGMLRQRYGGNPPRRGAAAPNGAPGTPTPLGGRVPTAQIAGHPASSDEVGLTCPYDQAVIKPGEEVVVCSQCDVAHHKECWDANGGCTTIGCRAAPQPAR